MEDFDRPAPLDRFPLSLRNQFLLVNPARAWYRHPVRATHPFLLFLPLLAAALIALNPLTAVATDLVFADGRTWTDVKIVSQEPTSLIVLHGGAVETVHAAQLAPECMAALKLRLPTEEELAERAAAEKKSEAEAAGRQQQLKQLEAEQAVYAARVELEKKERERVVAEGQANQPKDVPVVREASGIVPESPDPWSRITEIWIDGRLLSRVGKAGIVQANGPPTAGSRQPGRGWVQGTVFIHEDNRLNATYRDAPINGRVIPAGEYRYTDSNGVVHVLAAYRVY